MAVSEFHSRIVGDSAAAWKHAGRQLAQFWRDLRVRAPRHSLMILTAMAAGVVFIGAALSMAPTRLDMPVPASQAPPVKCEKQVWPYLDDTCLRRQNASHTSRDVRVISLDRNAPTNVPLPKAASGASKGPSAPPSSRGKDRQSR